MSDKIVELADIISRFFWVPALAILGWILLEVIALKENVATLEYRVQHNNEIWLEIREIKYRIEGIKEDIAKINARDVKSNESE